MGRVTTLKYLAKAQVMAPHEIGESAGTGVLAMPGQQEKPGQLDMTGAGGSMPKEYAVLPVPVGELTTTNSNVLLNKPVKDQQGKTGWDVGEADCGYAQRPNRVCHCGDRKRHTPAPCALVGHSDQARSKWRHDTDDRYVQVSAYAECHERSIAWTCLRRSRRSSRKCRS